MGTVPGSPTDGQARCACRTARGAQHPWRSWRGTTGGCGRRVWGRRYVSAGVVVEPCWLPQEGPEHTARLKALDDVVVGHYGCARRAGRCPGSIVVVGALGAGASRRCCRRRISL